MKKIFSIFAAVLFAGSMLAANVVVKLENIGSNLGSTANTEVATTDITATGTTDAYTLNYLQCKKQGNAMLLTKSVNPFISNKTPMPGIIKSVKLYINPGAAGKTTYDVAFGDSEFTTATAGVGAKNITGGNSDSFTADKDGKYFCVTLGNANNGQVLAIEVTCEEEAEQGVEKTLKSIALSGMTTQFENVDKFVFDGTVTATYSVVKGGEAQPDETREVTPTSVSEPDMTQLGDQEVTVSFTDGDVTKEAKYTITVTEHVVTPGTYDVDLNNALFGTTANVNITAPVSGTKNDVTAKLSFTDEAQTKPRTDATYVRFYTNTSLTLSVPEGFVITNVVFTKASSGDWQGSITANLGSYDDESKSWAGEANEVEFAFGAKNFVASAKVTYATKAAISAPVIAGSAEFFGKVEVSISCETEDVDIYYTIDGTDPTAESTLYEEAFELTESATVKAIAIKGDGKSSIASRKFTKLPSFDSLKDLVDADLEANALIEVSFEDVLIDSIYANKNGARKGVYVPVLDKNEKAIEIYYNNGDVAVPEAWVAGGTISGTIRGKWAVYNDQWEVVPTTEGWTWAELTYKAPTGTAIENTAAETKAQKVVRDGQLYIIRNGVMFNANGTAVK